MTSTTPWTRPCAQRRSSELRFGQRACLSAFISCTNSQLVPPSRDSTARQENESEVMSENEAVPDLLRCRAWPRRSNFVRSHRTRSAGCSISRLRASNGSTSQRRLAHSRRTPWAVGSQGHCRADARRACTGPVVIHECDSNAKYGATDDQREQDTEHPRLETNVPLSPGDDQRAGEDGGSGTSEQKCDICVACEEMASLTAVVATCKRKHDHNHRDQPYSRCNSQCLHGPRQSRSAHSGKT
jgi:hypothetical protein